MKKKQKILAMGMLILVAIGLALAGARSKEPAHGGRSLSSWLRVLHNPKSSPVHQQAAKEALRAMGTNLLPALITAMGQPDQGVLERLMRPARGLGLHYQLPMHLAWSSAGLLQLSISELDEPTRQEAVRVLFAAYVDERAHGKPDDQRRQHQLANSLFSCGDCFLEFLAASLTNGQPRLREGAASLVGFQKAMPTNFIGALAEQLSDPVPEVRGQALASLARFRKDSPMVVPLLRRGLGDSEGWVRRAAIDALRRFGPQAGLALPELRAVAERDLENRAFAIECIRGIDWDEADRLAAKTRTN